MVCLIEKVLLFSFFQLKRNSSLWTVRTEPPSLWTCDVQSVYNLGETVILYGRGFMVRPKSVLRSSSCPGTFSIRKPWSSVVRNTNISKRANPSPRQRLFPRPKMRTFSVNSLFNCPDGPQKRCGRNFSGSPQRSLVQNEKQREFYSLQNYLLHSNFSTFCSITQPQSSAFQWNGLDQSRNGLVKVQT